MQKVFVAQHHAEAHHVRELLEAEGISAEVRGEALFTTVEAAPVIPGASPEVWVLNPGQIALALDIVHRFSSGETFAKAGALSWRCPKCGEEHEPQFTSCWNCGTTKP